MKIHDTQMATNKTPNKTLQGFENKVIYKKPVVTLSVKNNMFLKNLDLKNLSDFYNICFRNFDLFIFFFVFDRFWSFFGPRDLKNRFPRGQISILTNSHQNPMAMTPNCEKIGKSCFLKISGNLCFVNVFKNVAIKNNS